MPDVFLSYSREDQVVARRFAEALEREGFSVWWDQTLSVGDAYDKVTERALGEAKAVLVLWSKTSVDSRWVRAEATMADRNGTLVPVMIEPCNRPIMFELTQTADLSKWGGDKDDRDWRSLVSSIRRFALGREVGAVAEARTALPPTTGKKKWRIAALLVAGLAVVAAAALWMWSAAPPRQAAAEPASIAVLPFTNMSSDKEQEYFSDGLSEELLNQLAQVPNLRVIGRTSSFAFKGRNEDLRKIGEMLGVNHILEGSVRKAGDRVRITAQLINPVDGSHLWSKTYERRLDDIFAIQDEIARTVASELQLTLGMQELNASGTRNVAAFDEFLAGRALLNTTGGAAMVEAVPHLERAVQLDSNYVPARLWLIDAYTRLSLTDPQRKDEAARKQDEIIDQVTRLVPGSPEASLALSYRVARGGNLQELERLLKEALRIPGGSGVRARMRYGQFLLGVGQSSGAIAELERVQQNEPLDIFVRVNTLLAYEVAGKFDRADQETKQLLQLPNGRSLPVLGTVVTRAMGRHDAAGLRQAAADIDSLGADGTSVAADIKGMVEDPRAALARLRQTSAASSSSGDIYALSGLAQSAAYLGDKELALHALATMFDHNFSFETVAFIFWRPVMQPLRPELEFKAQLLKMRLVEYWRATGNWGDFCRPVGERDFACQ